MMVSPGNVAMFQRVHLGYIFKFLTKIIGKNTGEYNKTCLNVHGKIWVISYNNIKNIKLK